MVLWWWRWWYGGGDGYEPVRGLPQRFHGLCRQQCHRLLCPAGLNGGGDGVMVVVMVLWCYGGGDGGMVVSMVVNLFAVVTVCGHIFIVGFFWLSHLL